MSQNKHTLIFAAFSVLGLFALAARASESGNFSSNQDHAGTVDFKVISEAYELKGEVGKPGAGKSESQNYVLGEWNYVAFQDPVSSEVSSGGSSSSGAITPADNSQETTQGEGGGERAGSVSAPVKNSVPAGLKKAELETAAPTPSGAVIAKNYWTEAFSNSGVWLEERQSANEYVALGILSVPLTLGIIAQLANVLSSMRSISDAWLVILKLWYMASSLFGLRRKSKYWGTVYDSKTKQPIDPAIVELVEAETGKVEQQVITDMAGRYGFLTLPGKYIIRAAKSHYRFPSLLVASDQDSIFDHLYHGEKIEISEQSELIAPNIPMDPMAFDWNQEEKKRIVLFHPLRERFINTLSLGLLWSGFAALVVVTAAQPVVLHIIFLLVYAAVIGLRYALPHRRLWGRVYDSHTHVLLSGVVFELSYKSVPMVLARTQSSYDGKFFLKCMPGEYILTAIIPGADGSRKVLKTFPLTVESEGMVAQDLAL